MRRWDFIIINTKVIYDLIFTINKMCNTSLWVSQEGKRTYIKSHGFKTNASKNLLAYWLTD